MIKITRGAGGPKVVLERVRVIKLLETWGYVLEKLANSRESIYELYLKRLQKIINDENDNVDETSPVAEKFNYICENVYKKLMEFDANQIKNEL